MKFPYEEIRYGQYNNELLAGHPAKEVFCKFTAVEDFHYVKTTVFEWCSKYYLVADPFGHATDADRNLEDFYPIDEDGMIDLPEVFPRETVVIGWGSAESADPPEVSEQSRHHLLPLY